METLTEEQKELLRETQGRLIKLLEALDVLSKTKEWKVLTELWFDRSVESIERQLRNKVLSPDELNTVDIYRLQGQWVWAKQHSDIPTFVRSLKAELENIKKQLQ